MQRSLVPNWIYGVISDAIDRYIQEVERSGKEDSTLLRDSIIMGMQQNHPVVVVTKVVYIDLPAQRSAAKEFFFSTMEGKFILTLTNNWVGALNWEIAKEESSNES